VEGGAELIAFADAVHGRSGVRNARETLRKKLGDAPTAKAAAMIAGFEAINRVADAAGTKLDPPVEGAMSRSLAGLGIEAMKQD
jgi:hypothetical protein